jgi:uroporphyrin-III C-methyltransferase
MRRNVEKERERATLTRQPGTIYFVGAGPGDPKLITVRGLELLQSADVVIYDRLVSPELLKSTRRDAELIYAGKSPLGTVMNQDEINSTLVEKAYEVRSVVRLKGGDPCIFGRVGEEAAYCHRYHVPFEMVPGITSGIAAPLYAGIPLTHRDHSSSVAFVTGHKRKDGHKDDIQWERLATGVDTLVVYMGINNLPHIRSELLQHGRPADTPVALVRWGTTAEQQTLVGTLGDIADCAKKAGFESPAIIVIGEVVRLRQSIAWFESVLQQKLLEEHAVNI